MKNYQKNQNGLLFLAGAIAGGAAVYFLQSPRGQKMKEVMLQRADQLGSEIKSKALDAVHTVSSTADNVLASANAAISTAQSKVVGATSHASEVGEETIDDFQEGIERAEAHIEERIKNS